MIRLRTGEEKRAAADWLATNNPDVLSDLKLFADAFGPIAEVVLELDDGEADLAVVVCAAQRSQVDECV